MPEEAIPEETMPEEDRYEFNFSMMPTGATRLGLTDPGLASRVYEISMSMLATEQEALRAFRMVFPEKDDPETGIRRLLGTGQTDLDEIMEEKLPELAESYSTEHSIKLVPRELREIEIAHVQGMLEATQNSLWENRERRYELTERLLEIAGVKVVSLLKPA